MSLLCYPYTMSQSLVFQAISGVEPAPEAYEASVLPLHHIAIVTMAGVEPARRAYEAPMLPLHHIVVVTMAGVEPATGGNVPPMFPQHLTVYIDSLSSQAMEGVEPSLRGYEPRVLPLHHIAVTDKRRHQELNLTLKLMRLPCYPYTMSQSTRRQDSNLLEGLRASMLPLHHVV